jgi:hypothetical protein
VSVAEAAGHLALALDPVLFARDGLGFRLDGWQQRALRWSGRRLLMLCARQTGKTTTAAILALHEALYRPRSLVLLVSPSLRQSSEMFRTVGGLLDRLAVRPSLVEDNRLSLALPNASRVVSLPSSEATVRGFAGVTLLIEDESARVSDALFFTTRPMLAVTNGRHILLSTPFGTRGHFYEAWEHGGRQWERIKVRADECPRITPEFLAEERESMGQWWFDQEFNCRFLDAQSAAFTRADIDRMFEEEVETWRF